MAKIITVTIAKGKVTADATGFHGHGCAATIDKLLSAVGKKLNSGHKPEYAQAEKQQVQQTARR
jgi:hypothetical protein